MSGLYSYDLHVHSCASADCETAFESLVKIVRRRGLSGIALTDHDTMDGVTELSKIWPKDHIDLIAGCERTLFDGTHLIGLFLKEAPRAVHVREVVAEIRAQGGIVYLPHPYREYSGILGAASKHSEADKLWIAEQAEIIEVFNRKCTAAENKLALKLAEATGKSYAAGSDAHAPHEIGMACTVFSEWPSPSSYQAIMALAPPEKVARREVEHRAAESRSLRTVARSVLKSAGLLPVAKRLRTRWREHDKPELVRYK